MVCTIVLSNLVFNVCQGPTRQPENTPGTEAGAVREQQRFSASVLKGGIANYLGCKETHQRGSNMMHRDSIPAESNFWEQCKWWTCTDGLTLLWHELQHKILSKRNWGCSAITTWVLCNLSKWTNEHYESFFIRNCSQIVIKRPTVSLLPG